MIRWGISENPSVFQSEWGELKTRHQVYLDLTDYDQPIYYQVKGRLPDGAVESEWSELRMITPMIVGIGETSALMENRLQTFAYPNPFNSQATIVYRLTESAATHLVIYNNLGQLIRQWAVFNEAPGIYRKVWDGCDDKGMVQPSGVYFYRLTVSGRVLTRKLLMMK